MSEPTSGRLWASDHPARVVTPSRTEKQTDASPVATSAQQGPDGAT